MSQNTATSILVYDPETGRSWYLDTADLRPETLTLGQLGHGLAAINRFGGYTVRPITVAEHSLRVGRFARALIVHSGCVVPYIIASAELSGQLHDTPEAITGRGDVLRPAKTDADRESEARTYEIVVAHMLCPLGPLHLLAPHHADRVVLALGIVANIVHKADNLALYYESMLWQPGAEDWAPKVIADPMPDLLLPLVWPRPREDWATSVRVSCSEICTAVRAL
jgi:5'-deoxynucleotidase YfbR-like HD superfamily hydrolase